MSNNMVIDIRDQAHSPTLYHLLSNLFCSFSTPPTFLNTPYGLFPIRINLTDSWQDFFYEVNKGTLKYSTENLNNLKL
jgi:hypothetical protein